MLTYLPDRAPIFWNQFRRLFTKQRGWAWGIVGVAAIASTWLILVTFSSAKSNDMGPAISFGFISINLNIMHFVLQQGVEAFARERERGTLESLLLTPISTRDIVLQKWFGATSCTLLVTILLVVPLLKINSEFCAQYIEISTSGPMPVYWIVVHLLMPLLNIFALAAVGVWAGTTCANYHKGIVTAIVFVVAFFVAQAVLWIIILIATGIINQGGMGETAFILCVLVALFSDALVTWLCLRYSIRHLERQRNPVLH